MQQSEAIDGARRSIGRGLVRGPIGAGLVACLTRSRSARILCGVGVILLTDIGPAKAEFTVCNQTLDVVNVSIGQAFEQTFRTEGWWTIGANRCVNVIQDPLVNRYIYVYANDVFGQPILNGTTKMCVGTKRFSIDGTEDCWERGHSSVPFYEVDTQAVERWTLFLQQPLGN